jgi:hypothetical protein
MKADEMGKNVARKEEKGNAYKVLVGKPKIDKLEYLAIDDRIILKWILKK